MPRKPAAPVDAEAQAPRRSTRISAQPKVEEKEEPKEKKPRAKKRSVAEGEQADEDGTASKKAKADEEDEPEAEESSSAPEIQPIDIGDSLPSLTLKNEKDEDVDVASLASDKGVVFFLVPKADTPGCTNQACLFRDSYPDFTSLDFDVYCLSADTPATQTKWQTKKSLPYPLLSDRERILIGALGAADQNKTKRSHFIFEKGGKLVEKKIPVKPADSAKLALEFIKSLSPN